MHLSHDTASRVTGSTVNVIESDTLRDRIEALNACPVLAKFVLGLHDGLADEEARKELVETLVSGLRNTRTSAEDSITRTRAYMALDWMGRIVLAKWLEAAQAPATAARSLHALGPVVDVDGIKTLHWAIVNIFNSYKPVSVRSEFSAKETLRASGHAAGFLAVNAVGWSLSEVMLFATLKGTSVKVARAVDNSASCLEVVPALQQSAVALFWKMRNLSR